MTIQKVTRQALRSWTDGPKVVIDYMNFWMEEDLPDNVFLIRIIEDNPHCALDIKEMIRRYSSVATYYICGYRWHIEPLQKEFPHLNFFSLEDSLDDEQSVL